MQPKELKSMITSEGVGSNTPMRLDPNQNSLLPGIPNDITVDLIAPKLPWRTFYVLSRVSPAWLHAIRSHQIFNARVRASSTQTLAVIKYVASDSDDALTLFSPIDGSYHELPPREQYDRGCLKLCKYVIMESRLYALDGQFIHFMDFFGQNGWKRCARLPERVVAPFACGVSHGKIYVFGKTFGGNLLCESYAPKEDTWSPITPMPYRRDFYHTVINVGEELFVHALRNWIDSDGIRVRLDVNSLDVYSPIKDEWRLVEPLAEAGQTGGQMVRFFMAQGKLYSIGSLGIYAYNMAQSSWAQVHSHSVSEIWDVHIYLLSWNAVQVVGNEVFATVTLFSLGSTRTCLVRSNDIGGGKEEIVWQQVQCPFPSQDWPFGDCPLSWSCSDVYPIQL